jgi:hypothetical protein
MRDLLRLVCFCKPCQPALDTKDSMLAMKASLWGVLLMALPSTFGCLGAHVLRPSLGRHASSGSTRLLAAMQDIWVSLHLRSRLILFRQLHRQSTTNITTSATTHRRFLHLTHHSKPCWVSSDIGHHCLKPLRGRHAYKASTRSALPDFLQSCLEI